MNGSTGLPTGTVTFLFTDIEGSTQLLHRLGEAFIELNDRHLAILRTAISDAGGTIVRTEGDGFFAAFPSAPAAVEAAAAGQRALADQSWPEDVSVAVRMGLHTGAGRLGGDDYVGIDVVRAARIADAGHGGQILVSESTAALIGKDLPKGTVLRDLGSHELKDLPAPEVIAELLIDGLAQEFPPLRARSLQGSLPDRLSSFIGREALVAQSLRLLAQTRLLTLVGPGGTGKTRLAIRVAKEAEAGFVDGSFFVELATVSDPGLAPSAMLHTLGIRGPDTASPLDHLLDHLRDKSLLLVLDNLEQILGVGRDVAAILEAASGVIVMATSRAPLGIAGEQELPVPPMAVPEKQRGIDDLMEVESIRLFTERAAARMPGFRLTDANAPAVVEVTRRLDGLPLAIELAANRVRMMEPAEISHRLGLHMLSGGGVDVEPRQQTMVEAIAWSYELLAPGHAALFRRLGIFSGGARLPQIEAVCRPQIDLGIDTLDGMAALVDQSLVQVRRFGESRYEMLHVLSEFARSQLSDDELNELRERHAATYLALAEEAQVQFSKRDRRTWFDRLERDLDNLRSALGYYIDHQRADEAMRFVFALWRLWQTRGMLHEGRGLVDQVLILEGGSTLSQMRAYEALGGLTYWQSDFGSMAEAYQRALDLSRELGDPLEEAHALHNASFAPNQRGDTETATAYLEAARDLYRSQRDDVGLSDVLSFLAVIQEGEGDYRAALEVTQQSIEIARKVENDFRLSWALFSAAYVAFEVGDPAAPEYLDESMVMFARDNDLAGIAFALGASALRCLADEDETAAALMHGAALRHMEIADTSLFISAGPIQARLDQLATLAKQHPAAFDRGRAMSTREAIVAARRRLGPLQDEGAGDI